jgi:hypothetical protein
MDQERVTDDYVTGPTSRDDLAACLVREWDLRCLTGESSREALLAGRSKQARHFQMGSGEQTARRVLGPDIGEEAQEEQRPFPGSVVDEPTSVALGLEAGVNMPPGVSRVSLAREPNDERSQIRSGLPKVGINQLGHGFDQSRAVGGLAETFPDRYSPYDRLRPGVSVIQVDSKLLRRRTAAFFSHVGRERRADDDVAVCLELLSLCRRQHAVILAGSVSGIE